MHQPGRHNIKRGNDVMKRAVAVWVVVALLVTALPMALLADGIRIGGDKKDVKGQGIVVAQSKTSAQHLRRDRKDRSGFWPGVIGGFIIGSIINSQNKVNYYCDYHRCYHSGSNRCNKTNWRIGEPCIVLRISDINVEREIGYGRRADLHQPVKIWIEGNDIRDAIFTVKGRNTYQEVKVYSGTPFVRIYPEDYRYGENVCVTVKVRQGTSANKNIDLNFTIR
jgi:hypothetical protein